MYIKAKHIHKNKKVYKCISCKEEHSEGYRLSGDRNGFVCLNCYELIYKVTIESLKTAKINIFNKEWWYIPEPVAGTIMMQRVKLKYFVYLRRIIWIVSISVLAFMLYIISNDLIIQQNILNEKIPYLYKGIKHINNRISVLSINSCIEKIQFILLLFIGILKQIGQVINRILLLICVMLGLIPIKVERLIKNLIETFNQLAKFINNF